MKKGENIGTKSPYDLSWSRKGRRTKTKSLKGSTDRSPYILSYSTSLWAAVKARP